MRYAWAMISAATSFKHMHNIVMILITGLVNGLQN